MSAHDFREQLARGHEGEAMLDRMFSRWFHIEAATDAEQRKGIDRWMSPQVGRKYRRSVEYKTDLRAHETGNAFIETVSVDTYRVQGWVYTSAAEILVYYVPGLSKAWFVYMADMRRYVPHWEVHYRHAMVVNEQYKSHGVLVPLGDLDAVAFRKVNV